MARLSNTSPPPLKRQPRSFMNNSGYDTNGMTDPFQDPPSAPTAEDTIASTSTTRKPRDSFGSSRTLNGKRGHKEEPEEAEEEEEDQESMLMYLTPDQREAAVENLDIETMDRIQKLRASVALLTDSIRFRGKAEIDRLPVAIRSLTMEEFWLTYNGNAKDFLQRLSRVKTVADTSFLFELGRGDQKRKKENQMPPGDLRHPKKRSRDGTESPFNSRINSQANFHIPEHPPYAKKQRQDDARLPA